MALIQETIASSGGDHTSFSAAEASIPAFSTDDFEFTYDEAFTDTTPVVFNVASFAGTCIVDVAEAYRCNGAVSGPHAELVYGVNDATDTLVMTGPGLTVRNLRIIRRDTTNAAADAVAITWGVLDKCTIIVDAISGAAMICWGANCTIMNCFILDRNRASDVAAIIVWFLNYNGTSKLYRNCIFQSNDTSPGIVRVQGVNAVLDARQNIVILAAGAVATGGEWGTSTGGTYSGSCEANASSSDDTPEGTVANENLDPAAVFADLTVDSEDMHYPDYDAMQALVEGSDVSATTGSEDIDGDTIVEWYPGADYVPAPPPPPPPPPSSASRLRPNPNSVRNIVKSSDVRVGGARSRIAFPAPLVAGNNTQRNAPVFDRDGNYNYRVKNIAGVTQEEEFAGVLAVLAESPVSTALGGRAKATTPTQPPSIPPDANQCEMPTGIQHAAEDQVLWHDTQGRKHIIYGEYITANLPQAQYTFKVADQGNDRTHAEDRRLVIVQEVQASPTKPVRIFRYNRTEAGDGKRFDPSKAIPMFFIKKAQSSGHLTTSASTTFIGEVLQHVFFPEIDADQRPDSVDLTYWTNEFCADELEEDQVAEPEDDGKVFTPGKGESTSQAVQKISQGGKQTAGKILGSSTSSTPSTPSVVSAAKKIDCKPGTPFRGTYPNGKVVVDSSCSRKLMHTEGLNWFLESRSNGLNSMFVFLPPYVVQEFNDGPVIPIITGNRLVASDKSEGDKDNNSTHILNDDGCAGDLDDLIKVKDVATITAQDLLNQLQKDKDQAFRDQTTATAAGDTTLAAQLAQLQVDLQARIDDLIANGASTKVAAYAMLRMLCAPDPRGVQITNGQEIGMLRDAFLLHGNWLALKTKVMFSLVGSPLDCGPGGITGPIRFSLLQGKECHEAIEEKMLLTGPTNGVPTPSPQPPVSSKPIPVSDLHSPHTGPI